MAACVFSVNPGVNLLQDFTMACVPGGEDAREYFTEEEWKGVVAIERVRLTNVLRNYRCMQAQGKRLLPGRIMIKSIQVKQVSSIGYELIALSTGI